MERLARLVMHHRRTVSALWVAPFIAGLFSAGALSNRWTLDFSLPGQPGDRAEQQLIKTYGVSTYDTYVAVVTVPAGETVDANRLAVSRVFAAAASAVPDLQLRVVDLASTGDPGFVTDDGRTTYALIQAPVPVKFGPYVETQLDPALKQPPQQRVSRAGSPRTRCSPQAANRTAPASWSRYSSAPLVPCSSSCSSSRPSSPYCHCSSPPCRS